MSDETTNTTTGHSTNPYLVPVAIVIAGIFVAGAIFATNGGGAGNGGAIVPSGKTLEATILPITEDDHVFGSRDADVFLVEYSDYRCGYCGLFHETIREILTRYEGKVAWVYRHTPYQPGGKEAAVASECIAELAGEEAFWSYTEKALANQKDLSTDWHLATAVELGADGTAFTECVGSGRYDARIAEHTMNMQELGGNGTPYSVLLTKKGDTVKFAGAQPIDNVALFVERALRSLE